MPSAQIVALRLQISLSLLRLYWFKGFVEVLLQPLPSREFSQSIQYSYYKTSLSNYN